MNKNDRIMVLGASGLVGSALIRRLKKLKYNNIVEINSNNGDLRIRNNEQRVRA